MNDSDSSKGTQKISTELTLDDLRHGSFLELKDHNDSRRGGGFVMDGSTDGLMGSTCSLSLSGSGTYNDIALNHETLLRAHSDNVLHRSRSTMCNNMTKYTLDGSTLAIKDDSLGRSINAEWEYPDYKETGGQSQFELVRQKSSSSRSPKPRRIPRQPLRFNMTSTDSTRGMAGDDDSDRP